MHTNNQKNKIKFKNFLNIGRLKKVLVVIFLQECYKFINFHLFHKEVDIN